MNLHVRRVDDHSQAILAVIERGRAGENCNIGGSQHPVFSLWFDGKMPRPVRPKELT